MEYCVAKEANPHQARLGAYYLTAKFGSVEDGPLLAGRVLKAAVRLMTPVRTLGER